MSDKWKKVLDSTSGKSYYYNKATRETTWTAPPGFVDPASTAAAAPAAAAPPAKKVWKEVYDSKGDKCYYFEKSNKSNVTWDRPTDGEIIPAKNKPAAPGESTPAASPAAAPAAAAAPARPSTASSSTSSSAAPRRGSVLDDPNADVNWRETVDPTSGKTYYYNRKTKETTWTDPRKFTNAGSTATAEAAAKRSTTAAGAAPVAAAGSEAAATRPAAASEVSMRASVASSTAGPGTPSDAAAAAPRHSVASSMAGDSDASGLREESQSVAVEARPGKMPASLRREQSRAAVRAMDESDDDGEEEDDDVGVSFLFAKHRKGWVNRTFRRGHVLDCGEIMKFKKSLIKKALLKQNRHLDDACIQTFKNIMSYMGDRPSSKKGNPHASKLLYNVIKSPAGLRDEVLLQLCKQTTANPSESSTLLGWELLVLSLATFPPSKPLRKFLMQYFKENTEDKESHHSEPTLARIREMAATCLDALPRIMELGQRVEVPCDAEIEAAKKLKPMPIRIAFLDGSFKTLLADSYTQVRDVKAALDAKLGVKYAAPFALYEASAAPEGTGAAASEVTERLLHEKERVLDLYGGWERAEREKKESGAGKQSAFDRKASDTGGSLVYRARLMLRADDPDVSKDPAAIDLLFKQCVRDVTQGRFPVKANQLSILAALQLQATFGDYHADLHSHGWILDKLDQYLPPTFVDDKSRRKNVVKAEWEQRIIDRYSKVKGFTAEEARLNYLDYCQDWPVYGVAFFPCGQRMFKDYPSPLLVGINNEGTLLVHPEKRTILDKFSYNELVTWGSSDSRCILVVGNVVQQRKLVFHTTDGAAMNNLIHSYVARTIEIRDREAQGGQ